VTVPQPLTAVGNESDSCSEINDPEAKHSHAGAGKSFRTPFFPTSPPRIGRPPHTHGEFTRGSESRFWIRHSGMREILSVEDRELDL
jgi:hypothetical protein